MFLYAFDIAKKRLLLGAKHLTTQILSRGLTFRPSPLAGVKRLPQPNYALGYHEAWEAHLHLARAAALEGGSPLTPQQELKVIENYITKNRKKASDHVICSVCQEAIAEAVLNGTDPFECPVQARVLLNASTERALSRWKTSRHL